MEYKDLLNGVFPPCATVFDENEEVAYEKIRENIVKFTEAGVRGYMPLGTNGEFRSLDDDESLKTLDVYASAGASDKPILAGCARESEKATVDFIRKAADHGANFASVLAPHYFASRMTEQVLIDYYKRVADASPLPVLLYNIPKYAGGIKLTPEIIAGVSTHENIAGIKDTSSDDIRELIEVVPADSHFCFLAGTINKFFAALQAGAIGGVLSIADYLPEKCVELQQLWNDGKIKEAAEYDVWIRQLSSNAAGKHGVAGVKAAMDLIGYHGGKPRRPLQALSPEQINELKTALEAEGII